jgi:hypothetical protein
MRGMHFCARTIPVAVILAPEISLIWPAGHEPSSTLTRCPSCKLTMSCSRDTCPSSADESSGHSAKPPNHRSEKSLMREVVMISGAARFTCSVPSVRSKSEREVYWHACDSESDNGKNDALNARNTRPKILDAVRGGGGVGAFEASTDVILEEPRAARGLEGWAAAMILTLRGSLRSHLRMTGPATAPRRSHRAHR